MARVRDKEQAITLRIEGKSYSQIKILLGVGKGTLSAWLRDYPLSEERIRELRDWNEQRIENYRATRRRQREALFQKVYDEEKEIIFPFSKRDIYMAGMFLYWGEGGKTKPTELSLSNTNPAVHKFFMHWLEECFGVERTRLAVKLHLYRDMNIEKEIKFWMKELGVKCSQFRKPYIKDSLKSSLTYKNGFGHGTCNLVFSNAIVSRRVLIGLKAIQDMYNLPKHV